MTFSRVANLSNHLDRVNATFSATRVRARVVPLARWPALLYRPADPLPGRQDQSAGGIRRPDGTGRRDASQALVHVGPHAIGAERFATSPAVHRSPRSSVRSWETSPGAEP